MNIEHTLMKMSGDLPVATRVLFSRYMRRHAKYFMPLRYTKLQYTFYMATQLE